MKTFKHRKTGEIATYKDGCFKQGNCVVEIGVEPSSEFWEEIIERDFEILSFKSTRTLNKIAKGTILKKEKDGLFRNLSYSIFIEAYENELLYSSNYIIYSIKRLSDGEIFTVGDKLDSTVAKSTCFIYSFKIIGNKLCIDATDTYLLNHKYPETKFGYHLHLLRKVKHVLFTTEDAVDIFEEDEYWCVWEGYCIKGRAIKEQIKDYFQESTKFFSTKEAAEKYILFNKPCLSIKEICSIIGQCNETTHINLDKLTTRLENLVKSKTL